MTTSIKNLTPRQAWQALPPDEWGEDETRHLLRRAGFSSTPNEVERVRKQGLKATLDQWFGEFTPMPRPEDTRLYTEQNPAMSAMIRETKDDEEKRKLQREQRQQRNAAYQDFGIRWLQFAREPANSVQEKYVLFLQDIFVVDRQSIQESDRLYNHQALLRSKGLGPYPELAKAVSRSPAMIKYLNLDRSTKGAPNENFARELFELFTLGEGNYTEQDIKQAARAFTGYRIDKKGFNFVEKYHDKGEKTVFGQTGNFSGDEVIDLVYTQPAARTFVPREMVKFYLSEQPLPEPFINELGQSWAAHKFAMSFLLKTFFASRIFYAPEYRMNLIKSPVQYYLGMYQDSELDIPPLINRTLSPLRAMGQEFFNPPNVRGWVGGRHWINATTLEARRQLAQTIFWGINEDQLNADSLADLNEFRAAGYETFYLSGTSLKYLYNKTPRYVANHLCLTYLPQMPSEKFRLYLEDHLAKSAGGKYKCVREVIQAILQSPQYQLC